MAQVAAAFGGLLRAAGAPMSTGQLQRFAAAVDRCAPATVDELYWVGRVTLVVDRPGIDVYDRVFEQVFKGLYDWADSRGDPSAPAPANERSRPPTPRQGDERGPAPSGLSGASDGGGEEQPEEERQVDVAVASREERLARTDFAELTDEELLELRRVMQQIRVALPLRRARRRRRHRLGDRLDLRATLRASRRSGGDPVRRVARRPCTRPRRLVVLCDISGSMAPYSRACIHLLHAAAGARGAEVYTFATRLTRLTRALAVSEPGAAIARASAAAPDWHGGTRIGANLKEFVDRHGRRGVARGAVVVILSDGWERDDPALVGEQMARLRRLAHRIVWVNPRRAAPGFVPTAGGMAAALPYCDALVSGHTLVALGEAMGALAG